MRVGAYFIEQEHGHAGAHDAVWLHVRHDTGRQLLPTIEILMPLPDQKYQGSLRLRGITDGYDGIALDYAEILSLALDRAATILRAAREDADADQG